MKAEERKGVFRKDVFIRHKEVTADRGRARIRLGRTGCSLAAITTNKCVNSGRSLDRRNNSKATGR